MIILVIYLIVVNVITIILYAYDKRCARKASWRISEQSLLTATAIGGSFGAFLGMYIFRHKTKHKLFQIYVPVFMFVHMLLILIIIK